MSGKLIQLDLFINQEMTQKNLEDEQFKKMTKKSFRGLFARYNEMEYVILEMNKRIDKLCDDMYGGQKNA